MLYFFYGTLLDAEVRRHVLGPAAPRSGQPARLFGYCRYGLAGKPYPTLVPGTGHVDGLIFDLSSLHQQRRLRAYEGDDYRVVSVTVLVDGQGECHANMFVSRRPQRTTISWSFDRWQLIHKKRCLRELSGVNSARR